METGNVLLLIRRKEAGPRPHDSQGRGSELTNIRHAIILLWKWNFAEPYLGTRDDKWVTNLLKFLSHRLLTQAHSTLPACSRMLQPEALAALPRLANGAGRRRANVANFRFHMYIIVYIIIINSRPIQSESPCSTLSTLGIIYSTFSFSRGQCFQAGWWS
jgi:hypothetical protein